MVAYRSYPTRHPRPGKGLISWHDFRLRLLGDAGGLGEDRDGDGHQRSGGENEVGEAVESEGVTHGVVPLVWRGPRCPRPDERGVRDDTSEYSLSLGHDLDFII